MTALISVETMLLVLLLVLVVGLLRSHAEILRRLGPPGEEPADSRAAALDPSVASPARRRERRPAPGVSGITPGGDAVSLEFAGGGAPTLLAFLTTGCGTCAGFWEGLGEPRLPAGVEIVIVTHGRERESPSRLRKLAPEQVPVIMSSAAWTDYEVPGSPYFVLVERSIRGMGAASTWAALSSLVSDAIADEGAADDPPGSNGTAGGLSVGAPRRVRDLDATLAAGGIGPDHPSLYPAGREPAARP